VSQFTSIYNLYQGLAKGKSAGFSIPAFNLRLMVLESARAIFRVAKACKAGCFIIELAQSEMLYTKQTLKEFAREIAKAAEMENYKGPIFLQGDHFKPEKNLEKLIKQAVKAGFYNIDIDCSAMDLPGNIAATNHYIDLIRKHQPKSVQINIGAEVGEIGKANTSLEQLDAFLQGVKGITKVAVQTGTSHGKGGQIDWQLLKQLSEAARKYGLAGIVQHGASMLSQDDLQKLPQYGVCEVHLATEIMDTVLESQCFPKELKDKIKTKDDLGPNKKELSAISQDIKNRIAGQLEEKFTFFFRALNAINTVSLMEQIYGAAQ